MHYVVSLQSFTSPYGVLLNSLGVGGFWILFLFFRYFEIIPVVVFRNISGIRNAFGGGTPVLAKCSPVFTWHDMTSGLAHGDVANNVSD